MIPLSRKTHYQNLHTLSEVLLIPHSVQNSCHRHKVQPTMVYRQIQPAAHFLSKVLLTYNQAHSFLYCLRLLQSHCNRVNSCHILWPTNLKIFTTWPFMEKVW